MCRGEAVEFFFYFTCMCLIASALVSSIGAVSGSAAPDEYRLEICTVAGYSSAGANLTYILMTVNGPAILREFIPNYAPASDDVPCLVTWYGLTGTYDPPYHIAVLGRIYVKVQSAGTYHIIAGALSFIGLITALAYWIAGANAPDSSQRS